MKEAGKIALIGGTGMVGRHVAAKALEKGYLVRMLVRNPAKVDFQDERLEIVTGTVAHIHTIQQLLKGCSIVINCFGQKPKDKPIYSTVTKNLLEVMEEMGIKRYLGVSGGSLTIKGEVINKLGAKMFELCYSEMMEDKKAEVNVLLANKAVDWTLIRLPFVREGHEVGRVKVSMTDMPGMKISNKDIAHFIIGQVDEKQYIQKTPFIAT